MKEGDSFERVHPVLPGDMVLRRRRRPRRRLHAAPNIPGIFRFLRDIVTQTPFLPILSVLIVLVLLFSAGVYFAERGMNPDLDSFAEVLWWTVTGMQTMGSAVRPLTAAGKVVGLVGVLLITMVFWGMIIASVTTYFALPRRRFSKQIIATIQYNLENLDVLSAEELEVLKETTVDIIEAQIEHLKVESSSGR